MKLQEVDINRAEGLRLCEELNIGTDILPKNHKISKDDIAYLKTLGCGRIFAAEAEDGDIDFDTALGMVAAKICGQAVGFRTDERGFCEIAAMQDGIFEVLSERISKFNRFSRYFILNTIAPYGTVKRGDIIARLEILTPILAQEDVDELLFALSGNDALLSVAQPKPQSAILIGTRFYHNEDEAENIRETLEKLQEEYQDLNLKFISKQETAHTREDLADALAATAADVVFILPAVRNYTANDVVFRAISDLTDDIICSQVPLLGGSDLVIAVWKNKKIIALPRNFAYLDSPLLDNFIRPAIYKPKLRACEFEHAGVAVMANADKVKDLSGFIGDNAAASKNSEPIAAVVLAAGLSKRTGKNKLLADKDGQPLALKAVQAAIYSKASPVFVVTGYQAEELQAALENLDINVVYNPNYRMGIKTSIEVGIKSVPEFCKGVLLVPADMPNLTPAFLNKMIAKFKKSQEKQLIVAEKHGVKSNPVLWSKALYAVANLVAENADMRPVFVEHSDYTTLIKGTDSELLDVNFQSDLDAALKV